MHIEKSCRQFFSVGRGTIMCTIDRSDSASRDCAGVSTCNPSWLFLSAWLLIATIKAGRLARGFSYLSHSYQDFLALSTASVAGGRHGKKHVDIPSHPNRALASGIMWCSLLPGDHLLIDCATCHKLQKMR